MALKTIPVCRITPAHGSCRPKHSGIYCWEQRPGCCSYSPDRHNAVIPHPRSSRDGLCAHLGPHLSPLPRSPARGAGLSQGKSFAALCWQLGREPKPERYPDIPKACRRGAASTQPLITVPDPSPPSASVGALQALVGSSQGPCPQSGAAPHHSTLPASWCPGVAVGVVPWPRTVSAGIPAEGLSAGLAPARTWLLSAPGNTRQ